MRTYRKQKSSASSKEENNKASLLHSKRLWLPLIILLSVTVAALSVLLVLEANGVLYGFGCAPKQPPTVHGSASPPIDGVRRTEGEFDYVILQDGTAELAFFHNTKGETKVTVPSKIGGYNVSSIGDECFWLTAVSSVTVPEGVTSIGISAFEKCYYLEEIVLPSTLQTVATDAFSECSALHSVSFPGSFSDISVGSGNDRLLR